LSAKRIGDRTPRGLKLLGAAVLLSMSAFGCNQEMRDDGRLKPYEPTPFFEDGRSSRPIEPGSVARTGVRADQSFAPAAAQDEVFLTGKQNGAHLTTLPMPVTKELLERGKERFNIYCAPCHAQDGAGKGMIVLRGFPPPPSYHEDRLRRAPVGYIYDVATNGYGVMYGYWDRVEPADRWAIAAYIKALQLSHYTTAAAAPAGAATAAADASHGAAVAQPGGGGGH
jgi:mono/diheme cytochrome c family protein